MSRVCVPPRAVPSAEVARRVGAKLPEFNGTCGGEGRAGAGGPGRAPHCAGAAISASSAASPRTPPRLCPPPGASGE